MIENIKKMVDKNKQLKRMIVSLYNPTVGKYKAYRRNRIFQKNGLEALYAIDDAFNEMKIPFWLEFGTLLGAVREKGFIEHDLDIDLACFFDDYREENEKIFNRHGLFKVREFLIDDGRFGREETYRYQGVDIDIFYFHRRGDEMYCHLFMPKPGFGWGQTVRDRGDFLVRELSYPYADFTMLRFYDREFRVPANIFEHLSASYGENFMIKDPNYSNTIATNVRILENKFGKGYLYA
jgi:phosphorylcholine metabolism protein LicD